MLTNSPRRPVCSAGPWLACALVLAAGCGGGGSGGTGGVTGSGGTVATGGSPGTGGQTGQGTGGATGGTPGTGGVTTGTGGSATGGTGAGTGGAAGHPGGGAGGRETGGTGGGASGGTSGQGGGAAGHPGGGAGGASCAGHAISFNANTAANNDPAKAAVLVAFNGSADLPIGNANRTIEFWAYVLSTSWSADANTMFFYGTNNRKADGFGLDFGSSSNNMGTIDPFTNNLFDNDNQPSGLSSSTNQWVHFAMTWDGTTVRAYVNGVLKASKVSTSSSQTTLMTGMSDLVIGGYPPAYFNGQIDEFRIWNVARSASEIASTMNHTLVGNEAGLTGYWKFDETSGTTAADSVTSTGHTAHPGMLSADKAADDPTFVVSTAPISCP
jgi:Concanavalin A-like lectin/glucanases superfamily